MKPCLTHVKHELYHYVDGVKVSGAPTVVIGDLSGIRGDLTGIRGDLTGIRGDLDDAEILTPEDREAGVDISALIIAD